MSGIAEIEEMTAGLFAALFMTWAVVTVVAGLAMNRHKGHYLRLRAKARRRMKRAVLQSHP
jgi:hypothetical protein